MAIHSSADSAFNVSPFRHIGASSIHQPQGVISVTVQLFFAWRVKVITSKTWAVVVIVLLAVVNCRELASKLSV